jgi:phage shock protein E
MAGLYLASRSQGRNCASGSCRYFHIKKGDNKMIQFLKNIFGFGQRVDIGALISNGAIIIDVRTRQEYKNGHLKNAVNLPLDTLAGNLPKLDKGKPIITCCASGMRSRSAKSILKSNGFTDVYNGGSWISLRKFEQ